MSKGDTDSNPDEVPIVVEAYGFKVSATSRPDDLGERPPSSWKDVPRLVNQHLMRIAVAPTRLVAEALEAVTRLIRGLSRIPASVANKLQQAHSEADAIERQRQQRALDLIEHKMASAEPARLLTSEPSEEDKAEQAMSRIQAILRKYRDQGSDAYLMFGPDGKPIIVFGVPPQNASEVLEVIEQTRTLPDESNKREP